MVGGGISVKAGSPGITHYGFNASRSPIRNKNKNVIVGKIGQRLRRGTSSKTKTHITDGSINS